MGDRSVGRELAFKVLFHLGFGESSLEKSLEKIFSEGEGREQARGFARDLATGCSDHLVEVDDAIRAHSVNWDLSRLGNADRAILRLATFELLYMKDIPHEVSIDQAVELAKSYGDDQSPAFVNGILDEIRKAGNKQV